MIKQSIFTGKFHRINAQNPVAGGHRQICLALFCWSPLEILERHFPRWEEKTKQRAYGVITMIYFIYNYIYIV